MARVGIATLLLFLGIFTKEMHAYPITYSFSGSGSGTIGSTAFTNVLFDLTALGDTSNVYFLPIGSTSRYDSLPATIDIAGIGTAIFSAPVSMFAKDIGAGQTAIGLGGPCCDLIDIKGPYPLFDLKSDYGPVTGNNFVLYQFSGNYPFSAVGTDLGNLTFTQMSDVSFVSDIQSVPEPSTFGLVALSVGLLGFLRQRVSEHCPL